METPKEYHYVYYSYEEYGRGYFGSRTCKCLPEEDIKYFGSFKDKTFKPTQKIILKDDYVTREDAYVDEIILQEYYKVVENPYFANRAYQTSTKFYYIQSKEEAIINAKKGGIKGGKIGGKIGGRVQYKNKIGIHGLTFEERSRRSKEIGLRHKENKTGYCGLSFEERSEYGKIGGKKAVETNKKNKTSFWDADLQSTLGKRGAKKTNTQKWKCTETGFIANPGNLTQYQRARGIDTSKRIRVS